MAVEVGKTINSGKTGGGNGLKNMYGLRKINVNRQPNNPLTKSTIRVKKFHCLSFMRLFPPDINNKTKTKNARFFVSIDQLKGVSSISTLLDLITV